MTKQLYNIQEMQKAVEDIKPQTATAVIKHLLPTIKKKREEGVTLVEIWSVLAGIGLKMNKNTFLNTVARLTREAMLDEPSNSSDEF